MNKYKVKFLPDQREVEVDEGTSLFEAAEKVGYSTVAAMSAFKYIQETTKWS